MRSASTAAEMPAIAERLRSLRETVNVGNQRAFAEFLGISAQAWNNYEKAGRRISLDEALKVVRRTGVTLDWIYFGDERGLPLELATALRKLDKTKRSA